MTEKIVFNTEDGEVLFYVLEQTRVNGVNYLLVSESEDEEAECLILKDTASEADPESVYEEVTDEDEQDALLAIFTELLEDTEITKED